MIIYLNSKNQEEQDAALLAANICKLGEKGNIISNPEYVIDTIGIIYRPTGNMLETDGIEYPEMTALEGWHCNILGDFTEEQLSLLPIINTPNKPVRIFWGW